MNNSTTIDVHGNTIGVIWINGQMYASLTDIVNANNGNHAMIGNWLSTSDTVEFLGIWEQLNNPVFNFTEYHEIKNEAGPKRFVLSVKKWVSATKAIGLVSKTGRYGSGTYAHVDIALEFCSWISPAFKLYVIKEFQRLKQIENDPNNLEWNMKRVMAKANYHIHTAAVKEYRVPLEHLPKDKEGIVYADEAEILNYAVFGFTSKQWKTSNPDLVLNGGNLRDYASINELLVLTNMESINSIMLASGMARLERIAELRRIAQQQLERINKIDMQKSYRKTVEGTFINQIDKPAKAIEESNEGDKKKVSLSDFNQKLNTALNYNPKDKGEQY